MEMVKVNLWNVLIVIVLVLTLANLAMTYNVYSRITKGEAGFPTEKKGSTESQILLMDDDPVMGDDSAPVTIVMYSDPSCPFCAAVAGAPSMVSYMKGRDASWEPSMPNIEKDFVETGKVRLAYRYTVGHGTGGEAMKIMLCANEQGKFWEVHDQVYLHQDQVEDIAAVKKFAIDAGADSAELDSCLASGRPDAKMAKDQAEARKAGVQGTPAMLIEDELIGGAVGYAQIKPIIEGKLA